MRKLLICVLLSFVLLTSMISASPIASTPAAAEEGTTQVTFRVVSLWHVASAWCEVSLHKYPDMESTLNIDDDTFRSQFSIARISNWEYTMSLTPGFYEIVAIFPGITNDPVISDTPRFEVKGEQMTVYICAEDSVEKVPRPDEWLVYGEDSQDFFIWAEESENPSESTDSSNDTNTSVDVEPLPEFDNSNIEADGPNRPGAPTTSDPDIPQKDEKEEKVSVKIGNYLFTGFAIILLGVCIFLLHRQQKRRGV